MHERIEELNRMKLRDFRKLYSSLQLPEIKSLSGYYHGSFIGPRWLRVSAEPGLQISGLDGWWGKHFVGDGNAFNLIRKNGGLEMVLPMRLINGDSMVDGKPGLALHYETRNPFPWPYIVDELRLLEQGMILGMTYIKARLLRGLVLPFLLEQQKLGDGS